MRSFVMLLVSVVTSRKVTLALDVRAVRLHLMLCGIVPRSSGVGLMLEEAPYLLIFSR